MRISPRKFRSLPETAQHKILASLLEEGAFDEHESLSGKQFEKSPKSILREVDKHRFLAGLSPKITTQDQESSVPFLPISIYLDEFRSAHNVGSIIRTCEAYRLGELILSENTPGVSHPGVKKTAMGCEKIVPVRRINNHAELKKPIICMETAPSAPSIETFSFPREFTLVLGNEASGICSEILQEADQIVQIPLVGSKNSLNVSCSFAIVAHKIRHNL